MIILTPILSHISLTASFPNNCPIPAVGSRSRLGLNPLIYNSVDRVYPSFHLISRAREKSRCLFISSTRSSLRLAREYAKWRDGGSCLELSFSHLSSMQLRDHSIRDHKPEYCSWIQRSVVQYRLCPEWSLIFDLCYLLAWRLVSFGLMPPCIPRIWPVIRYWSFSEGLTFYNNFTMDDKK